MQKFASGDWGHLFGPGLKETRCRIVIDLEKSELIAAQEWTGLKFEDVRGNRLEGLADSVLGVNEAHENPADWGLDVSDEMPEWVEHLVHAGNVAEAKPSRAVSLSETTLTFSLPDDFGAGWEYVNQRLHGASHAWAGSYDKSESANFAHEALMQVQGVDSSYLATGMTCNVSFVVNDIAEAVAIQSRLQAVVDAFESRPERSISVRGANFYDSKVTEYDANDPDVEIVSDMPYLNYLAKYVPLAEALPALSRLLKYSPCPRASSSALAHFSRQLSVS